MSWRVAKALEVLRDEIDAAAPERSKVSDGYVGDQRHAARRSDHNACDCHDVVCAADWTHDPAAGFDSYLFAEWLRHRVAAGAEPRVKYVISDGRIFSGEHQPHACGVWRRYTGSNPHAHHVHVSVRHGAEFYDDPVPWHWPPPGDKETTS
jgi:hypothetical protein